ncbi:putative secreted protein [Candidatus Phytoplasma solani]|uniref:hypothetical protein n=1 Tax=Candidatus Phytoplasma solani TaxID=69896 RepID=UPI0032DBF253
MKLQTKNKIFATLVVFISLFFAIATIAALDNFFAKQRKEKIKLMNAIPSFTVERVGGNNEEKSLLPIPIPNLNEKKYKHLIDIQHKAILHSNGMEITTPLYLKILYTHNTNNTFANPNNYFTVYTECNGSGYQDAKRPLMTFSNGVGIINIKISIQQDKIIEEKNPELELICDYELVDSQGKSFGGGTKIENKITQFA